MTMREIIARAMYGKNTMYFTSADGVGAPVPIPWEELSANDYPEMQAAWLEDADAVLDAMREPDEAMIEAYFKRCSDLGFTAHITATAAWQTMTDAAKSGA